MVGRRSRKYASSPCYSGDVTNENTGTFWGEGTGNWTINSYKPGFLRQFIESEEIGIRLWM